MAGIYPPYLTPSNPDDDQGGGLLAGLRNLNYGDILNQFSQGINGQRNSLIGLGLGLMAGNPYDRYGPALRGFEAGAATDVKAQNAGMTGDIKEYQYAKSQGYQGSFQDWLKQSSNLKSQYGLNPQWVQKPDGSWGLVQLNNQGDAREVNNPIAGGKFSPTGVWKDTGEGYQNLPGRQTPYGLPGGQPPSGQPPGGPTTSATDDAGRPVVRDQPAGAAPGYVPKNLIAPNEQGGMGAGLAKEYTTIQEDARKAVNVKSTFARMRELNDTTPQGALAPLYMKVRSGLASLGVDPGNVPQGEEFTALSNRLTYDTAGGSFSTGFSNGDRDYIAGMHPSVANTREGRTQMIDAAEKVQQRKIEVGKLANQWFDGKIPGAPGQTLRGFNDYLTAWSEQNPVFGAPRGSSSPGGGGGGSSISPEDARRELERRRRNQM